MINPDRYMIRRVVNDLIDALINEGLDRSQVRDVIGDMYESDREFFDIDWLYNDN